MQLNVYWGLCPQTPGVYQLEDTGEAEKQQIDSAALHRISCSSVGSLSSVALFCCIFSIGMFSGLFVFTQLFFQTRNNPYSFFYFEPPIANLSMLAVSTSSFHIRITLLSNMYWIERIILDGEYISVPKTNSGTFAISIF